MNISFCIPTWRRRELVVECCAEALKSDKITEIVIVDDASCDGSFDFLKQCYSIYPKVKLYENESNLDCYYNKHRCIELATNKWCIIADSDNIFGTDYLDILYSLSEWDEKTIYTPSFAKPHFDFRDYEGLIVSKENVAEYIEKPMFETMLNAANYFVNRDKYLEVWDGSCDPVTSDSIYQVYNWLKAGYKIKVVPCLQYEHRVWDGSHYINNVSRTPIGFHEDLLSKIKNIR